jgi:hypothetical protein
MVRGTVAATLTVGANGRVGGYVPLGTLAPMSSHVLELSGGR